MGQARSGEGGGGAEFPEQSASSLLLNLSRRLLTFPLMRRKSERIEKDDFRALSHRWKSVFERKKGWSCAEPRGRITSLLQRSAPPNDFELPTQTAKCVMESMEL